MQDTKILNTTKLPQIIKLEALTTVNYITKFFFVKLEKAKL